MLGAVDVGAVVLGWCIFVPVVAFLIHYHQQNKIAKTIPCPNCKVVGRSWRSDQHTIAGMGAVHKTFKCGHCGYRW